MSNTFKNKNPYLAKNLRKIRILSNIRQQEISDALGINRTTYAKWEQTIEPSLYNLGQIIKFYNEKGIFVDYNKLLFAPIQLNISLEANGMKGNNL